MAIKVLTCFYVTDSPLRITNITKRAKFYLNLPVLMNIPWGKGQLVQLVSLNKVLTCFYVSYSPLSATNIAELLFKLTEYPLGEGPVSPTG